MTDTPTTSDDAVRRPLLRSLAVIVGCSLVLAGTAYGAVFALTAPGGWVEQAAAAVTSEVGPMIQLSYADPN